MLRDNSSRTAQAIAVPSYVAVPRPVNITSSISINVNMEVLDIKLSSKFCGWPSHEYMYQPNSSINTSECDVACCKMDVVSLSSTKNVLSPE